MLRRRGGSRERVQWVHRDDLRFSNTTGILQKKKTMWFIGVEVEQEKSAPPPKKKSWIRPCADVTLCAGFYFLFRLVIRLLFSWLKFIA